MSFQFKSAQESGGNLLFLHVGEPVTVKLLEHYGKRPVLGHYAKNDKGDQQYEEAFRVLFQGVEKELRGPWRLRRALQEALKASEETEPTVTITTTKDIEVVDKSGRRMEVKNFAIRVEVPF